MGEHVVEPGVGWSVQVNFTDVQQKAPRSLVAQMHLPLATSPETLNAHLDAIREAMDRQVAYYALQEAEEAFADHLLRVREMEGRLVEVDELVRIDWENRGRHGEPQLSAAQKNQKAGAEGNLRDWKTKAEHWRKRRDELRVKVNGHASVSSANSHAGGPEG